MSQSVIDTEMMSQAIQLARRGDYGCSPNPRVGCVICRDNHVVARGWHQRAGRGHAEVNALAKIDNASGCTAYVSLEPCSHQGKTSACADALIKSGVRRVVVAMEDPNPLVGGRGIQRLRDAGIKVDVGVLAAEAATLNPGFNRRIQGGLPWLRLKSAMSVDGRTAMASGESQWITGPEARADVQRLRAQSCAIISGVDTVLHDDAALTVRPKSFVNTDRDPVWRQPLRVIVDSHLRISPQAKLFTGGGEILIATLNDDAHKRRALLEVGASVQLLAATDDGRVSLPALLHYLAKRECNEVLVEAGATLAAAFMQADLVDEWTIYMAPCLLGSEARPLLAWPMTAMAEQQALNIVDIRAVGKDWRIQCRRGES